MSAPDIKVVRSVDSGSQDAPFFTGCFLEEKVGRIGWGCSSACGGFDPCIDNSYPEGTAMIEFNYTLFIQFFQLLILLVLLDLFLFKPVLGSLNKRRAAIDSLAGKAEDSRQEADALAKAYGETRKERKAPVLAQREGALKEAHAASMKIVEEARRELAGELAKVKETVKKEAENTLDALLGESDRLALEIAQKIGKRGG